MMIFDTDIIIWIQRGNEKAAKLVEKTEQRLISIQTYMELMQCAKSKQQLTITRSFLHDSQFKVLPFTENIGHRASVYIDEYSLAHGIRAGDAIIAATATENNLPLSSSNVKHYKMIQNLQLKIFKP